MAKSERLKSSENYYAAFRLFVRIAFLLYESYNSTSNINHIEHAEIAHFCHKHCFDCDTFEKIFKDNGKVQIKNFTRKYPCKKLRQILVFFYMKIMKLPSAQYFIPSIIINFFLKVAIT